MQDQPPVPRRWRRLLALGAIGGLLLLSPLLLLGRHHFCLGTALSLLGWPLAVAAVAVALWLRRHRRPRVALLLGALGVLLAAEGLHRELDRRHTLPAPRAGKPAQLDLLSFNVMFRGGQPAATVETIRASNADLIALQEVTPAWAARVGKALAKTHPYRLEHAVAGTHGLAIYARYPLGKARYVNNRAGRAIAQCARVLVPSRPFLLCNVHLASPSHALSQPRHAFGLYRANALQRREQWRSLTAKMGAWTPSGWPAVVAGDLNTLEFEPLFRLVRKTHVDAFRALHLAPGGTFPRLAESIFPAELLRIDYVLLAGPVEPLAAEVLQAGGSDHLPVRATLRL